MESFWESKQGGSFMKKQKAEIERIMKKTIKHMVDTQFYEWPPQCSAFLYQPVRPKKMEKNKSNTKDNIR